MNGHLKAGMFFSYLGTFGVLAGAGAADVPVAGGPRQGAGEPQPAQRRADDRFLHARAETAAARAGRRPTSWSRTWNFATLPDQPVLRGINLTIPFGQRVAFVGPSGSGKSTLAKMFLRLYDPDEGSVSFGDEDLRCCKTTDVRQRFGIVPQDPYFFQTSIRENLLHRLPRRDARNASAIAARWRASGVSSNRCRGARHGDRRGRLAPVGRAAAAAGDCAGAAPRPGLLRVRRGDERARHGERTHGAGGVRRASCRGGRAIFIAHRLSTVKDCDRIIVLDEGRIVQDGTFEHLRNEPGLFQRMVESDDFSIARSSGPSRHGFTNADSAYRFKRSLGSRKVDGSGFAQVFLRRSRRKARQWC